MLLGYKKIVVLFLKEQNAKSAHHFRGVCFFKEWGLLGVVFRNDTHLM